MGGIRAGVMGAGVFGGYHANKYAESERAVLTAVFDLDEERAKALADRHGCVATTDLDVFFEQVDAVTVAAPAKAHGSLAASALAAGKHVLVEKPIALDLAEADALIAAAAESRLVLQVGHQERYVFDAIGVIGRSTPPTRIESRRLGPYSERGTDVSVVMDLMIHDLDLAVQLVGAEPRAVKAERKIAHGPHPDRTRAELSFDGAEVVLEASRIADARTRDMRLVYPDGEILIDFMTREVTNTTPEPLKRAFGDDDAPLSMRDPLAYGTEMFLAAVAKDEAPIVSGGAGRRALALALAIEAASA
ncbi:MAG: Gfo/Idh/MocA family oxidoreductase [Pseudomonadota bacterium]